MLTPLFVLAVVTVEVDYSSSGDSVVPDGTRLEAEADYFDAQFGGLPRTQAVAVEGAAGKAQMRALRDAGAALLDGSVTVATPTFSDSASQWGAPEFCERALVPDTLRAPTTAEELSVAFFYQRLTERVLGAGNGLNDSWGIDRFPCRRQSALDCFSEGDFDYPQRLRELDSVAVAVSEQVIDADFDDVITLDYPSVSGADLGTLALLRTSVERDFVPLFASWGYTWRRSFEGMADDGEVVEHLRLSEAAASGLSGALNGTAYACRTGDRRCCLSWDGLPVPVTFVAGAPPGGAAFGAARTVVENFHPDNPLWGDFYAANELPTAGLLAASRAWELAWTTRLGEARSGAAGSGFGAGEEHESFDVLMTSERSREDALEGAISDDLFLAGIGFALVAVYSMVAATSCRGGPAEWTVLSRWSLSLAGVVIVTLSVGAAIFVADAVFAVRANALTLSVVLLLGLGLGVDDMFVVLTGHADTHAEVFHGLGRKQMAEARAGGGPERSGADAAAFQARETLKYTSANVMQSVLFTSCCNAALFATVAGVSDLPLVRDAAAQMALSVAFVLFGLVFGFLPLCALDSRRVHAARLDPLICCFSSCVDGHEETKPHLGRRGAISKRLRRCFEPAISSWAAKFAAVVLFFGTFSLLVVFSDRDVGFDLAELLPDGGFEREYADLREAAFSAEDAYLVTRPLDAQPSEQDQSSLIASLAALDATAPALASGSRSADFSWLSDQRTSFASFACFQLEACNDTSRPDPLPSVGLALWPIEAETWNAAAGATFSADVRCESASSGERVACRDFSAATDRFGATRSVAYAAGLSTTDDYLDAISAARSAVDEQSGDLRSFMYGQMYRDYEQFDDIENKMLETVGYALLAATCVAGLLLLNPVLAFFVGITCCMVVGDLWSLLHLFDAEMNAFTVLNLAVAVAITVDFTGHMAYVYQVKDKTQGRAKPLIKTMRHLLAPILHGAFTTILSLLPLIGANFTFYRVYFAYTFLVMIALAVLHALLLFPVFLFVAFRAEPFYWSCTGCGACSACILQDDELVELEERERELHDAVDVAEAAEDASDTKAAAEAAAEEGA